MQGERATIGSLPGILDFDHGSSSSDDTIDQQICLNDLRDPAEDWLSEFVLAPNDTNVTHLNSGGHGELNLNRWSLGEPSSRNSRNEICCDEPKMEHGRSSSLIASAGAGPRIEEQYETMDFLSMDDANLNFFNEMANDPLLLRSPLSDALTRNIDINARSPAHGGDDCQVVENLNTYKTDTSLNERALSASSSSDPCWSHSRNGWNSVDARPDCSLQGHQLSRKRKALELVGQSSVDGSSTFQHAESSARHVESGRSNNGSSLSLSPPPDNVLGIGPSDQVIMRPGMLAREVSSDHLPSLSVQGSAESVQRSSRARVNPSHIQDPVPNNLFSRGGDNGHLNISSPSPSVGLLPVIPSPDLGSAETGDGTSSQNQSFVVHIPPLPQNGLSFRRNGASSSGPGNSSSHVISGVGDAMLHEESNSRNITEHPSFIPTIELGNSAQNSIDWDLTGGNISILGNVASTSITGSRSGSSSVSHRVPHRTTSSRYPRRLSELIRRSLLSIGSESGGNHHPFYSGPSSSSQEMVPGSVAGGLYQSRTRSASLLDRQGDGILGFPHSLRNLSIASEGRSRILSEIRNALDLVHRGDGLRFEDQVMFFGNSAFLRGTDAHDRHRDMRLDVDNMSYEELLALEERIGNVSTGLSEETISNYLKQHKYSCTMMEAGTDIEPCCICQEDYSEGADLGMLDCSHEFHAECIKQWLIHKNLCPICKMTALRHH